MSRHTIEGWHWLSGDVVARDEDGARVARHDAQTWWVTNRLGQLALGDDGRPAAFPSARTACHAVDEGRFSNGPSGAWLRPHLR